MNNALQRIADIVEVSTLRTMVNELFLYEQKTERLTQTEAVKEAAQGIVTLVRDNLAYQFNLTPKVENPENRMFQLIENGINGVIEPERQEKKKTAGEEIKTIWENVSTLADSSKGITLPIEPGDEFNPPMFKLSAPVRLSLSPTEQAPSLQTISLS
ncbi:MAG: hypothetical protein ACOX50_02290 [Patescibacteria group bacterium]|jgi:hypothetical protein